MVRFLFCTWLILLSACGKQEFPDYKGEDEVYEHQEPEAQYRLSFVPLNRSRIQGKGIMWVRDDQFYVKISIKNAPPFQRFQQFLHTGRSCPGASDDMDHVEVQRISGARLIPLDQNLSTQTRGSEWFPVSNRRGLYFYSEAVSLPEMMNDLRKRDPDPGDDLVKLASQEQLDLHRRVVLIYGTGSDPLRPVACAEIIPEF